jgi:hypothetical protein
MPRPSARSWAGRSRSGPPFAFALLAALACGGPDPGALAMPAFRDVAPELGLGADAHVYGPVLVDFDRDGLLDVLLTSHLDPLRLYRQVARGRFEDVAAARGLRVHYDSHGAAWGDCDGDGRLDLYLSVGGGGENPREGFEPHANHLFQAQADGSFRDVARDAGVDATGARGRAVAWADVDGDADLDLLLGHAERPGYGDRLFRNEGGCRFSDASEGAGDLTRSYLRFGTAWSDYDADGDMDLFGAEGPGHWNDDTPRVGRLLRNDGGIFADVTEASGLERESANGMAWGDYDGDGAIDLFVARGHHYESDTPERMRNRLYRNLGHGRFEEVAERAGVAGCRNGEDAVWADFDNDGDLDLYVVNGRTRQGEQPNFLYQNLGGGRFRERAAEVGATGVDWGLTGSVAAGDLDGDGFVDLAIGHGLSTTGYDGPTQILRNQGNGAHWLQLALVTRRGDRMAFGARVQVETSGGRVQLRELNGGVHRYSQDELLASFGLGRERHARVVVRWPGGAVQELRDVRADQRLQLEEPLGER